VDKTWTGSSSTAWSTNGNWTGNAPGAGDNAVFNSTFSNQPAVSGNTNAGGIWFTGSIGQSTTISGSGTLTLQGNTINGTTGLGILIDNANAFTLSITAALKVGNAQTWTNNSGNLLSISTVDLNNKGLTVNGSGNTTITGVVSSNGTGTITKSGTGTLTLQGANSYTGTTTVSGGVLNIQNATALGTTAGGTTVSSGATLQIQGGITVGTEALNLSGNGASGQTGAFVNVSGTNNYGGLITLGAASTISSDSGTLNITNTGTILGAGFGLTLAGSGNGSISSIIGTTTGSLTKTGAGTWTLSGINTYTGGTNINGGTLSLGSSGALGTSGTISFGGGTMQYTSSNTTDYSSRFSTAASQSYSVDTNGQNATWATALTSSGGTLAKTGSGTLTMSGASTYTGATTINGGTLSLDSAGTTTARLANTSAITVNSGGTLLLANSSGTTSNDRIGNSTTMTLNGGTFSTGGLSEHGASNNTAGIGALTLQTTSIIDMGSAASIIAFANSAALSGSWSGTLKIYNWTGNATTGGGTDQLFFGNDSTGLTASQLAEVQFFSGNGTGSYGVGALILANGEVVAIPETSTLTICWAVSGFMALTIWRRRRSRHC
jgi:autotransporter-associated beta strand protein